MVQLKVKTYLSRQHLQSADQFAASARGMETQHKAPISDEVTDNQRAYVIGAIFAVTAFLEAAINEIFDAAAEEPEQEVPIIRGLAPETRAVMAALWNLELSRPVFERFGALDKFQTALKLAKKPLLPKGNQPYQDARLVISLRNALIHYEPEWIMTAVEAGVPDPHHFEQSLRGKFDLNPFGAGQTFYPQQCLGYGCARWALVSAMDFVREFFSRMQLTPWFQDAMNLIAVRHA